MSAFRVWQIKSNINVRVSLWTFDTGSRLRCSSCAYISQIMLLINIRRALIANQQHIAETTRHTTDSHVQFTLPMPTRHDWTVSSCPQHKLNSQRLKTESFRWLNTCHRRDWSVCKLFRLSKIPADRPWLNSHHTKQRNSTVSLHLWREQDAASTVSPTPSQQMFSRRTLGCWFPLGFLRPLVPKKTSWDKWHIGFDRLEALPATHSTMWKQKETHSIVFIHWPHAFFIHHRRQVQVMTHQLNVDDHTLNCRQLLKTNCKIKVMSSLHWSSWLVTGKESSL